MLTDDKYVRLEARERALDWEGKYVVRGMAMIVRLDDWNNLREFIDGRFHEHGFYYILRTKLMPDPDPTKSMSFYDGDILPWEPKGQWDPNHCVLHT